MSFVSKFATVDDQKGKKTASNADLFKHLKNAAMGGSGDFFRGASGTSASNKKQY